MMELIYENIMAKPRRFRFLKSSKVFIVEAPGNEAPNSETWHYIDEFVDKKAFEANVVALDVDRRAAELRGIWQRLIVPGSFETTLGDTSTIEKIQI